MANTSKFVIESVAADKRRNFIFCPEQVLNYPHNYELHYIEEDGSEVFYAYAFSRKVDNQFALFYADQALIEERFGDNCGIWGISKNAQEAEFRVYKKLRDYAEHGSTSRVISVSIEDKTRFASLEAKTS